MFSVPRYNPNEIKHDGRHAKGKKRRLSRESTTGPGPTPQQQQQQQPRRDDLPSRPTTRALQVIAPDEEAIERKKNKKSFSKATADEAVDDFDLLLDNVEEQQHPHGEGGYGQSDDNKNGAFSTNQPEIQAALHVTTLPMEKVAEAWELAPFLRENLKRDGFESFFPIQALVIPEVITSERHPYLRAQDVCLTAPTGSGKTLGYALPILNALSGRQIRRLRALVVLPGRDLARQVHSVFNDYVKGSDLKVGLAIGQSAFKAEQMSLMIDPDSDHKLVARQKLAYDPINLELARVACGDKLGTTTSNKDDPDSSSAIDILVCTPGRLVDHLDNTPGFTLQHLRFLVVDEADRLLSQTYQNWIDRVIEDANSASVKAWRAMEANNNRVRAMQVSPEGTSYRIHPITWRRGGSAGDTSQFNTNMSYFNAAAAVCRPVQLRKFLVSATLTKDPQKLATLKLVNPKHFDVHQLMAKAGTTSNKFSMAQGLSEYSIECKAEQKPVVLLALLLELLEEKGEKWTVVVFTASVDSTHRLARLLQLLWLRGGYGKSDAVVEFSSALNQTERTALLSRCRDPEDSVSVLVCSDGMSRGMDLDSVHAVINYDVPTLAKTYVHRCGRTARAGKSGIAISILKGGQVVQFRRMRELIQEPTSVQAWNVKKSLVKDAVPTYRQCLQTLRQVLKDEDDGDMSPTALLDKNVFAAEAGSDADSG